MKQKYAFVPALTKNAPERNLETSLQLMLITQRENRRVADGRVVQRHLLYLGEINDSQQVAWRQSIEIFDQGEKVARTVALVAAERQIEQDSQAIVRIRVDEME